jgi:enamine deaminase RidA (YjgF/YER057c/UK114 family)
MKTLFCSVVSAFLSISAATNAAEIRCVEPKNGIARAVIVGAAPLAHTTQLSSPEAGDLEAQIKATLGKIDMALKGGGSALAQAVKLNVYVTQDASTTAVENALATAFSGGHQPAVSWVTTPLPAPAALVAIDAIGVSTTEGSTAMNAKDCAILPAGPRIYISGQAEKGDGTLADATAQTMASLGRTLDFLGLTKKDVVQVKSFLTPMTGIAEAEKAIATFFGDLPVPPCSYVEWKSGLPIEIEMVVAATGNAALSEGPSVEVRTPPGMTTPAVYSRLTIARHPVTVYSSGLYSADNSAAPETQLRSLFAHLKQTLDLCGSDWMHLVKATYYVSDDELSKWHNTVRPDYFSPRRPPAASKAAVAGTGRAGHGITMDFIVVPGEP